MAGKLRFIVTAGPTREYLDPVRFLTNPSSGRMGFAIALAAAALGYETVLVAGPVALRTPRGVGRIDVVSARDMLHAVRKALDAGGGTPSVLVMSAAVADWRPARMAMRKLKKIEMESTLRLARNPDILKTLARDRRIAVRIGFAAETGDPVPEAIRKCREKRLDAIVANDVTLPGAGFGTSTNRVEFIFPDGRAAKQPMSSKAAIGRRIVRLAECLAEGKGLS